MRQLPGLSSLFRVDVANAARAYRYDVDIKCKVGEGKRLVEKSLAKGGDE